ncbi:MAG: hypothetical protein KF730_02760 [Sphingomonas sp.]|uniref:hypothetical protein n=1 Tax=Sphingomonas sp. TaxID=28214 RepID=UPI0025D5E63F|nr:hypothetical protein [Sphingomonas sp.]MBX3563477.1 hypothetical protein [Sphingomonas sp.]
MAKRLAFFSLLAAFWGMSDARACSILVDHEPTFAERRASAEKTVAEASVILDGEVVEAGVDGGAPARIRVIRVFKGTPEPFIHVFGDSGACDLNFERVGERWRFVLFGTADRYRSWVDYSNARAIDRVLKSDRRKDWPLNTEEVR